MACYVMYYKIFGELNDNDMIDVGIKRELLLMREIAVLPDTA